MAYITRELERKFLKLNDFFMEFFKVIVIQRNGYNSGHIYAGFNQILIVELEQQIGLSASANAGNCLYHAVFSPLYQSVQM